MPPSRILSFLGLQKRDSTELNKAREDAEELRRELSRKSMELEDAQQRLTSMKENLAKAWNEAELAMVEAEKTSRLKSEFLSNMNHEFRTPMNGIIGLTSLALDTDLTIEQQELLEGVAVSSQSLMVILNNLLDLSNAGSNNSILERFDFDLRVMVDGSLEKLIPQASDKGLALSFILKPDVPTSLLGDPGRLRQVLTNLVDNAVKFSEAGEIVVLGEVESKSNAAVVIHFSISDTGIGIPQAKQDEIFDTFTQVDGTMMRKYGGSGIGLPLARHLVEMMGGRIWVECPSSLSGTGTGGPGSTFHFTASFPLHKERTPNLLTEPVDLRGNRILLADDSYVNRLFMKDLLTNWGCVVTEAKGGREAQKQIEEKWSASNPYRLIVLDGWMPDMDGFTVAEWLKDYSEPRDTEILLVTSMGQRGDGARCRELGIGGYLPKPLKKDDFRDAVTYLLWRKESRPGCTRLITQHTIREDRHHLLTP